jgi:5-methylcytosine-specific restriction endonuclease McrA
MVFTEDIVKNAFDRVNGYCQTCGKKLVFNSRGNTGARGAWEARHIKPVSEGGKDEVRNCAIFCMECYNKPAEVKTVKKSLGSVEGLPFGERRK